MNFPSHSFFELLEPRRLLAASLANGVLTVTGSNATERIDLFLSSNGSSVVVSIFGGTNDSGDQFSLSSISSIHVNALDGFDIVAIAAGVPAVRVDGGAGGDEITGGDGNDSLIGGAGNDFLEGKGGNDMLDGGIGADRMFGNDGIDTADYSSRNRNLTITLDRAANDGEGGEGDNVQDSVENVLCGSGNDSVSTNTAATGNSSNNYFWGNGGNDLLDGGVGNDSLDGGEGNDDLRGNVGYDFLDGWTGNDVLDGGDQDDVLWGYDGDDILRGGNGNDWLVGEAHNDLLDGGLGADNMEGWGGIDTVDYSSRTVNLKISLDDVNNDGTAGGFSYRDPVTGLWYLNRGETDNCHSDIENVKGGSGDDQISSPSTSAAVNHFWGNDGNDVLDGGGGADILEGGAGNDIFYARDGAIDQLFGGADNDRAKVDANDVLNSIESTFEGYILIL